MDETINSYPINDRETLIPMSRKKFYAEQIEAFKEHGKPTKAVDIVDCFIFNSKGEVLLQKRSYNKFHNAGIIDKTLGGHVQYGDPADFTVLVETVQELQTPSIVLKNKQDFTKTFKLLSGYLETVSLIKLIDSDVYILPKIIDGETIDIANRIHFYLGVYNGRVKPADGEAQGVLWYPLDDLMKEIEKFPETFTSDVKILLDTYSSEINDFRKMIIDAAPDDKNS